MVDKQKVAIVTGAARGIGYSIALRLAHEGFKVAIADIDDTTASSAAQQICENSINSAFPVFVDTADPQSVRTMVDEVIKHAGRIDALVNNAGIAGTAGPVLSYSEEEWRHVLSIDLDGVFYCCKAALPHLLKSPCGRIVNMASISGKEGNPNMAAYSTAKAGVIGFTKALGKELATSGVLVNCVTPAVIETEILEQLTPDAVNYMVAKIPMGRVGQPSDVSALVAWLCSEQCSFSTGAVFDVSGGRATY